MLLLRLHMDLKHCTNIKNLLTQTHIKLAFRSPVHTSWHPWHRSYSSHFVTSPACPLSINPSLPAAATEYLITTDSADALQPTWRKFAHDFGPIASVPCFTMTAEHDPLTEWSGFAAAREATDAWMINTDTRGYGRCSNNIRTVLSLIACK